MAKLPAAGRVKTRLAAGIGARAASAVHAAMLRCVLRRTDGLGAAVNRVLPCVLAVDGPVSAGQALLAHAEVKQPWRVLEQGDGPLGERMERVWRTAFSYDGQAAACPGPVVFLGSDSPDVPTADLAAAVRSVADHDRQAGQAGQTAQAVQAGKHDAAAGPTADGGYWTLAARWSARALLVGIDWGSDRVYDQTCAAAARHGLDFAALSAWHDVDEADDLLALRRRLETRQVKAEVEVEADPPAADPLRRLACDLQASVSRQR